MGEPEGDNRGRYEILAVDDTPANLKLMTHILVEQGYVVRPASSGEMALRSIGIKQPDIILLDEIMPNMDGIEVCKQLKADLSTRDIPVLFISACEDSASKVNCFKAGANDYITKPYSVEEVLMRIDMHLKLKANQDYLSNLVIQQTEKMHMAQEATISSFAIMSEIRDLRSCGHIQRTKAYVSALLKCLKAFNRITMSEEEIALLVLSAPLHDIGKVGISDAILYKPYRLTEREFEEMKKHTVYGYDAIVRTEKILGKSSFLNFAREMTLSHHERWDGSGYPNGLAGDKIPFSARVMMVADVYDALVTSRAYREPVTHEEAYDIMMNGDARIKPVQFDPMILEAFDATHEELERISRAFD